MNDELYENYRRDIIERHICNNGRFLQDVLLDKETKEVVYVEEDGQKKLVGGGDNPFLYGGLMMAVFSIESMHGVSEHSLGYATKLFEYFYGNDFTKFRRKKNWWREYKSLSKDELSGLILGLHFYLQATIDKSVYFYAKAMRVLSSIAIYLHANDWKPAGSWLFRYPFGQIFEYHLGRKYTKWYDKYIFRWTMRGLPLAYQLASFFKMKRNFFNIAMYTHCLWMIYLTQELPKGDVSAYNKLHEFFCTEGWRPYQGQEAGNNYIELTQNMITYSDAYSDESLTEHEWSEELPNCSVGGPQNDTIGECFTWEHPNSGNHNLEYEDWPHVLWRLGPSNKGQLDDMGKEFIVESCGLGLLFIRALSYHNVMSDMPILENDSKFNTLPLEGPY